MVTKKRRVSGCFGSTTAAVPSGSWERQKCVSVFSSCFLNSLTDLLHSRSDWFCVSELRIGYFVLIGVSEGELGAAPGKEERTGGA